MEITVNQSNFESEVLNSEIPVLVDFWAPWCGPCRMLAPIVEEIAKEYDGKIKVCKINVDENIPLAMKYDIEAIPALFLFKDGKAEDKLLGLNTKSDILNKFGL